METNDAVIRDLIQQWHPDSNTRECSAKSVSQIRSLVAAVPPKSKKDAASMLSAAARYMSDLMGEHLEPDWSDESVRVWSTRAIAHGMAPSTAGRYRAWLLRLVRVANGLPGRIDRRESRQATREGIADHDIEYLIELAGGSHWLWWCVVAFGAGRTGNDAAGSEIVDGQVWGSGWSRPLADLVRSIDVPRCCPGSNWLGFRRWCSRNGVRINASQVSEVYRDLLLDSNIPARDLVRIIGRNQLDAAARRGAGRELSDSELLVLR